MYDNYITKDKSENRVHSQKILYTVHEVVYYFEIGFDVKVKRYIYIYNKIYYKS